MIENQIKSLYEDYLELIYLGKSHNEALNEFKYLDDKMFELLKRYVNIKTDEKTKNKTIR